MRRLPWTLSAEAFAARRAIKDVDSVPDDQETGIGHVALAALLLKWDRAGRVSYGLAPDLVADLIETELSETARKMIRIPHPVCFFDYEMTDGAGTIIHGAFLAEEGVDGEPGWFPVFKMNGVPVAANRPFGEFNSDLFHVVAGGLLYLMDPEHDEERETLHGNREWRAAVRSIGVRDPEREIASVIHRVLGAKYRRASDDAVQTGDKLALRVPVRGHWRLQRVGAARSEVRTTWVRPHWRGPETAPNPARVVEIPPKKDDP